MSRRNTLFRRSLARMMDQGYHNEEDARESVRRVIRWLFGPSLVKRSKGEKPNL